MPWNAEDHGGCAMLRITSRHGRPINGSKRGVLMFTPEQVWHWPDLTHPGTLAHYVRQAVADLDPGEPPQNLP